MIGSLDILFITDYKGETMQTETDLREAEIELAYQYLRQKDWERMNSHRNLMSFITTTIAILGVLAGAVGGTYLILFGSL